MPKWAAWKGLLHEDTPNLSDLHTVLISDSSSAERLSESTWEDMVVGKDVASVATLIYVGAME